MTFEIALVFLITLITFYLFATERLRTDLLAMCVLCLLGVIGVFLPEAFLTPGEVLSSFSNPAPITVAAMFVLGAGLTRTGAIEQLSSKFLALSHKGQVTLMLTMLPVVTVASSLINNTAVVTFFLPIVLHICTQRQIAPSRLLIPLSYAAMFGGCCTLIGTSSNIVVDSVLRRSGHPGIEMFEPTKLGLLLALIGFVYLVTIGRFLLPERETLTTLIGSGAGREFRTELVVLRGSPLIGRKLGDVRRTDLRSGTIIGVWRDTEPVEEPFDALVLAESDRIVMNLAVSHVHDVQRTKGLALLPETELGIEQIDAEETATMEAVVPANTPILKQTLDQLDLFGNYGIRVLAMHRHGMNVREHIHELPLRLGDTLLLQAPEPAFEKLRATKSVLLLAATKVPATRRRRALIAVLIVAAVMLAASIGHYPVANVALIGAVLMVLTGCLDMNEGYEAVNWNVIFLIAGMLGLGLAMEKTGAAAFVAISMNDLLGSLGPHVALAGLYFLTMLLTELVSHSAVAALMTPVAILSAEAMGCDARPFVFAVMFAATASFSTPVGYQTNTMVYSVGGYRFTDYFKIGIPLNLIFWITASLLIPKFWPLELP